jgi:hypothetical protein
MLSICSLVFLLLCGVADNAAAGDWELPSDVGVTLAASSAAGIVPGQPIDMTFSVTNHGTDVLPLVLTSSSFYVEELDLLAFEPSECLLYVLVFDLANGGYEYAMNWDVASADFGPPLQPGETRVCHFQIALTANAPAAYEFDFGLPTSFHDPNPANDRASVVLRRAPPAAQAAAVPSLSTLMVWMLAGLCLGSGALSASKWTN